MVVLRKSLIITCLYGEDTCKFLTFDNIDFYPSITDLLTKSLEFAQNYVERKDLCKFLKFDIVDSYLSITEDLPTKLLEFAQNYVEVDEHTVNIIKHCHQSILFSNGSAWSKKNSPQFDVAMSSFNGAEVCELVGLYDLCAVSSIICHWRQNEYWPLQR